MGYVATSVRRRIKKCARPSITRDDPTGRNDRGACKFKGIGVPRANGSRGGGALSATIGLLSFETAPASARRTVSRRNAIGEWSDVPGSCGVNRCISRNCTDADVCADNSFCVKCCGDHIARINPKLST